MSVNGPSLIVATFFSSTDEGDGIVGRTAGVFGIASAMFQIENFAVANDEPSADAGCLRDSLRFSTPEGAEVHLLSDGLSLVEAGRVLAALGSVRRPAAGPGVFVLKKARQRFVARVTASEGSVIVKVFPLASPLSWLRWRKYAWAEFRNQCRARQLGCPVPRPLGFFLLRRWGFVVSSGLIMEDLRGWEDLRQLSASPGGPMFAAGLAEAPLRKLVSTGCCHVDARDENILVSPDRSRVAIIDWQYASFPGADKPWVLEHLVAYYLRKSGPEARALLLASWVSGLAPAEPGPFVERVKSLLAARPSTRARLEVRPV
jgi:hypothetical protein